MNYLYLHTISCLILFTIASIPLTYNVPNLSVFNGFPRPWLTDVLSDGGVLNEGHVAPSLHQAPEGPRVARVEFWLVPVAITGAAGNVVGRTIDSAHWGGGDKKLKRDILKASFHEKGFKPQHAHKSISPLSRVLSNQGRIDRHTAASPTLEGDRRQNTLAIISIRPNIH